MLQHEDKVDKFTAATLLIQGVRNFYEKQGLEAREST